MLVLPVAFMKISERTLRISASSFLALLMVSASYLLSGPSFLTRSIANAGSTEELLKEYAEKDTDRDGLPDWQEALYNTDPNNPDSDNDGLSDGDAAKAGKLTPQTSASQLPSADEGTERTTEDILSEIPGVDPAPGSITEQFSREFFQEYIETSRGQPLTEDKQQGIITKLLASFQQKASQSLTSSYTRVSVRPSTIVSSATYAGTVEDVLDTAIPDAPDSDLLVLSEKLIKENDTAAKARLLELSEQYAEAVSGLLLVPTPPALVESHTRLIRALDQVSRSARSIANLEKDPVLTMGAISMLVPSRDDIMTSLGDISQAVLANGEPAPGSPGMRIVDAVRREQAKSAP